MWRPKVIFKSLPPRILGECDGSTIWIDVQKQHDFVRTYVHELLHLIFPYMSHRRLVMIESFICRKMDGKDREQLLWQMFSNPRKEDRDEIA